MPSNRSRSLVRLLALLAALGLLLAACGDDAGDDTTAATDAAGDPVETAPEGCQADVCMEGISFTETEVTIAVGETVSWTNLDGVDHTVTAGSASDSRPDEFDSGNIGQGESFDQTFDAAGSFDYYCQIHPAMEGTVLVE